MGIAAKATPISVPTRLIAKEGLRVCEWSSRRSVILSDIAAMSVSRACNSCDLALSSRQATSSIGWVTFSR